MHWSKTISLIMASEGCSKAEATKRYKQRKAAGANLVESAPQGAIHGAIDPIKLLTAAQSLLTIAGGDPERAKKALEVLEVLS